MPVIKPPKERCKIEESVASLKISIPARKNYFMLFFLGFWLIGWAFGEVIVSGMLLAGIFGLFARSSLFDGAGAAGFSGGGLFLLAWLGGWTLGGGFALYAFFWQLAGKEMIEVSYDSIKIRRAIFGYGKTKEYMAAHIKDLRISPAALGSNMLGWSLASSFWGISGGLFAFDYGAKTFRFGIGVDEAEAKQILEKILARFPQYRVRKSDIG